MKNWVKILSLFGDPFWGKEVSIGVLNHGKSTCQLLLLVLFLLSGMLSLTACDQIVTPDGQATPVIDPENFPVDPIFVDFYLYLGGEEMMGPAISPLVERDGKSYQYTVNSLMVFDPTSPATEFFKLFPIGKELGIYDKHSAATDQADPFLVNGHLIGEPFRPFFEQQKRLSYGAPLTEMFYNRLRRRYEQYFEGVAFYQMKESGETGLLAYGSFMCGESCKKIDVGNSVFDYSYRIAPVFRDFVNQYGIRFTGFPIGDLIYLDGSWIQVFQNIVLMTDAPDQPQSVRLFPIAVNLGVLQENPLPPTGIDGMNFFSTTDGLGYDIPDFFWNYLLDHGGLQVSGAPISHSGEYTKDSLRQCFENLCLLHDKRAENYSPVYPYQLGYQFLGLMSDSEIPVEPTTEPSQHKITLRVEENQPVVRTDEHQEVLVTVLRNGFPVSGVDLELTLTLPDNSTQNFILPETGSDGRANLQLPMIQAENGSVILYQVCVINQDQANFCYEDSFAIWDPPE